MIGVFDRYLSCWDRVFNSMANLRKACFKEVSNR